jgi:hypothetical protein
MEVVIPSLKLSESKFFSISNLAKHWSSEPNARSRGDICQNLIDAYWNGEFEQFLSPAPEHWPESEGTFKILRFCDGIPLEAFPEEDGDLPSQKLLIGLSLESYPVQGQAVMNGIELPKDMIKLWCLDQGHELPTFWFQDDEVTRFPGRPSIAHRFMGQLVIRSERGELEASAAAEARFLYEWAIKNLSHESQIPKSRTIENIIRVEYRTLKAANIIKSH